MQMCAMQFLTDAESCKVGWDEENEWENMNEEKDVLHFDWFIFFLLF